MKRLKKEKGKKVRTTITLDEDVLLEVGLYVDNLSGYINACLKNAIASGKKKEESEGLRIIDIMSTDNCDEYNKLSIDDRLSFLDWAKSCSYKFSYNSLADLLSCYYDVNPFNII